VSVAKLAPRCPFYYPVMAVVMGVS